MGHTNEEVPLGADVEITLNGEKWDEHHQKAGQ